MKHFVSQTNPMRAQFDAKAAYSATHFAWSYEQVDEKGGVGTITLNRPERLNAWTPRMEDEFIDAINASATDSAIGCVVVTGAGRGFAQ